MRRRVDDPTVLLRRMLVNVDEVDGHWIWRGAQTRGYGAVWAGAMTKAGNYRAEPAHRVMYRLLVGPIPEGLSLDHLCLRKLCVNPAHLEPVTQAENVRRWFSAVTECKHGHPFTPENTYIRKSGRRACRACNRTSAMAGYRRRMPLEELAA